jgi:DNA modification methylase
VSDWTDGPVAVLIGDVRERLRELPDESVQCVVTSPPYWGLRDYGTDPVEWSDGWIGSLGLEPTPEMYVAHLVEVFRAVRRVLRLDGTVWVNLGDSYASDVKGSGGSGKSRLGPNGDLQNIGFQKMEPRRFAHGLKPKDLVMIPARVALALQAESWWLRSDVIWAKPNPMPESVTDRPTTAHEHVFLLAKSERYFYDAEAVRETATGQDHRRAVLTGQPSLAPPGQAPHRGIRTAEGRNGSGRNLRSVWTIATQPYAEAHFACFPDELARRCIAAGSRVGDVILDPFAGSGPALAVARRMGRRAVGIELQEGYLPLIRRRVTEAARPLLEVR